MTTQILEDDTISAIEDIDELDLSNAMAPTLPAKSNFDVARRDVELTEFYNRLQSADAEALRSAATRIHARENTIRKNILETGKDLLGIQAAMAGVFDQWLDLAFGMSKRTAWNYISVAREFSATPQVVEFLPPSTAYALAASGTPESIRKSIIKEITDGVSPKKGEVERRIAEAKVMARKEREEIREKMKAEKVAAFEKVAEEKAWANKEKELKKSGATDDELKHARIVWYRDKERKEKAKKKALEALQTKREAEEKGRGEEVQILLEKAYSAAVYLMEHFSGDRRRLIELMAGVSHQDIAKALQKVSEDQALSINDASAL
ncbi:MULTISPECIES: hypothetical protein [Rhizobium/Agrobacterium group]|uniref:hypothetical protein n=1 Tax=Rhizobium/Agrobacterium group TaxID=227290 RepID=UPI00107F4A4D|nr:MULTISPECIES: hypothetical protein [Rhizobium/Agrobacterium group]MBB4401987.1 hypothetical protein [Agrobacterium radiobacter]MBB5587407.1 hypothetical protein [Agrobacterium radiobacter]TGE90127.1 hypothetical protein C9418_06990 [Rhizobium sp. SEMIA 4032]